MTDTRMVALKTRGWCPAHILPGLAVHPFTFRSDDLPQGFSSFEALMQFAVDELCIDGLFTDFPDLAVARQE